jgi:c-di-GMP-binding flagellar brake protein YcgR
MPPINTQERRRSRRVRIGQPLKIRASDQKGDQFEETSTTKNVSRDGIYFVSQNGSYFEGMRLFVAVPHHTPKEPLDREYLGQVARVDKLSHGQWGIAVQFLSAVGAK